MSIKDIFFGEKNVKLLTRVLGEKLDIDDTREAREACRNFLLSQMKLVFEKNKEKIMQADPKKILPKLNEKSLNEVLKIYAMHRGGGGDDREERDSGRGGKSGSRGGREDPRRKKQSGPQGMYSGVGDAGYAPLANGEGTFYTATGEIGNKMFFGNQPDMMTGGGNMYGKKGSANKDELDRLVMMRRAEYEGGEDYEGEMGGMGPMGGMDGMMNPYSGYGYMPMNKKQRRPPEINFCVDGGDTRGIANGSVGTDDMGGGFNPMMMNPGMMNPGMMNPGMNPNMNRNGMMNPGMNPGGMGGMNQGMMNPGMMNPAMMNPGMNPMMGGNGGSGKRKGDNGDVEARLAQMEAERNGTFDNGGYNPMFNQNMMNNGMGNGMNPMMNNGMGGMGYNNMMSGQYNQNFQMGGRGGSSELEELVKDKKRELANKLGLDPEMLMGLKHEQLESLLKGGKSDESDDSDSDASDDSDDDNKGLTMKEILLKKLMNKKKMIESNHKKLGKNVKSTLSEMEKKKKEQQKKKRRSGDSDEQSDETESDDESEDRSKNNKGGKHNKKAEKKPEKKSEKKSDKKRSRNSETESDESDDSNDSDKSEEERQPPKKKSDVFEPVDSKSASKSTSKQDPKKTDSKPNSKTDSKINTKATSKNRSESDDDTDDSDSSEDTNTKSSSDVKVKKRDSNDRQLSVTKSVSADTDKNASKKRITIKSDDWTEPQFFNNYKVDLDVPLNGLIKIAGVTSSEFPLLKPDVDESHNTFCIIYKKEALPIELEPRDDYTLTGIIRETNEALEGEEIPIKMRVDKKGYVTVESTKNEKFDIDLTENSIGPYLGFQEQKYSGKTKYTSECPHMFVEQSYYMFIREISPEKAVCEITPEGKVIQLIKDISTNSDVKIRSSSSKPIKSFTIQYRNADSASSPLTEFYEEPHEITFEFLQSGDTATSKGDQSKSDRTADKSTKRR
ncbi:hypothetical protein YASMINEVIRUS_441 [Yasminevirus sp. GU-2018]|uniref:Uncharacterized protein n=1 Tax=Yasminevirus sp. GU-2018 TaxID=2420051 RepID=A0A5K0U7M5_9VIRU|nr:hypothetical protein YASMINEVIRUS_441 [Yasminevirus sp. GU-2018]